MDLAGLKARKQQLIREMWVLEAEAQKRREILIATFEKETGVKVTAVDVNYSDMVHGLYGGGTREERVLTSINIHLDL